MTRVDRSMDPLLDDEPQTTKSPIDIMDEALFFLHHLIVRSLTNPGHKHINAITADRDQTMPHRQLTPSIIIPALYYKEGIKTENSTSDKAAVVPAGGEEGQPPKIRLFMRFYGRVSQKIFKKFLYFSLNSKDLQFTKQNLLELYYFTDEFKNIESLTNFNHLISALSLIVNENRELIDVLLEQIVESNYVSSLDEFANLKGMKLEEYTRQLDVKKEEIEEQQWNQYITPFKAEIMHKKKTYAKHRGGRIFQKNFKQELQVLLTKYQDTRQRDAFMEIISKEIEKDNEREDMSSVQMSQKKRLRFNTPQMRDVRMQTKEIRRKSNRFYKKYFQNEFVHPIWNPLAAETQQNENFMRKASRKETKVSPKQQTQSNSPSKNQNPSSDQNLLLQQLTQMNIEQQTDEKQFRKKTRQKPRIIKTMLPNQRIPRMSRMEERDSRKQLKQIVDALINDVPHIQIQKTESSQQSNVSNNIVSGVQRSVESYVEKFQFQLDNVVRQLRTSKQIYYGSQQSNQNTQKIIREIQKSLLSKKPLIQEHEPQQPPEQFKTQFNCKSQNQTKCTSKVSTAYLKKRVVERTKSANPTRDMVEQVTVQKTLSKQNTMRFWTCFQVQPDNIQKQVKIPAKPIRKYKDLPHFRQFLHTNLRKIYFATKN